jgi:hypothetical protein
MVALVKSKARPLISALYDAQQGICPACGRKMPPLGDPALPHLLPSIDHVIARAKGGGDHIGNMIAMHRKCNSTKSDRMPTGCEIVWHHLVLARLEMHPADMQWRDPSFQNPAMAEALALAGIR